MTARPQTPLPVGNQPGLTRIERRIGTYRQFLDTMRARLSDPEHPELAALTVRSLDDPAIALLDAGAVLGDVLTFYTERIATEGYLRTATEEQSLRLLGRLVGHRPRPGIAAGTFLAYTLDRDPAGSDPVVVIPRGSRVQSVPSAGTQPQAFETSVALPARPSWNDLAVIRRRPIVLGPADLTDRAERTELRLAGTATNLAAGDRLLFVFGPGAGEQVPVIVAGVRVDPQDGVTVVSLPAQAAESVPDVARDLGELLNEQADSDMPERSRQVRRFLDEVLAPMIASTGDLTAELDVAIDRLAEAAGPARPYPAVREWFAEVGARLAELRERAQAAASFEAGSVAAEPFASRASDDEANDPALRGLGTLIEALRRPPAALPVLSQTPARDPAAIYTPGSDAVARLIGALDPQLRDSLYPAWRQVDVTAAPELDGVQALRVVANPFGATAPLQAVIVNGQPSGQREWSLAGNQLLAIQVGYQGGAPQRSQLSFTDRSGEWFESFDFDDGPQDRKLLGPGTVSLAVTRPAEPDPGPDVEPEPGAPAVDPAAGVTFSFDGQLPNQQVFVSYLDLPAGPVRVRIGDRPAYVVEFNHDDVVDVIDGWQVRIRVSERRPGNDFDLNVTFEAELAAAARNILSLDAVYPAIAPGSWVVIDRPQKTTEISQVITRVLQARVVALADFGITGKVTQLRLADDWLDADDRNLSDIRETSIYARGEPVAVATEPIPDDVSGDTLELADLHDGLDPGRWAVVSGERTDIPGATGVTGTEVVMIGAIRQQVDPARPGDRVHTVLTLVTPLSYRYRRETVQVAGNVVRATAGASRDEAIGSGDASAAGQSFVLFAGPLTWLPADNPLGAASTLQVRVAGVLWHEVDSFAGRGPDERVYVTSTQDDGRTRVSFGDGEHGARLPTGVENVRAAYRVGLGADGNLGPHRITQLITRPLGVSGVDNPVPSVGGADPDGARELRRGIPLSVTALDRLVGVTDYADFARARAGIGRAAARRLSDGTRQVVQVTVAGPTADALAPDADVVTALRSALVRFGDRQLPVVVDVHEPVLLVLAAGVRIAPDFSFALVEPLLRAALLEQLGYSARELGQPAYRSEVLVAAHRVPGVDYVDVDTFLGVPGGAGPAELERLTGNVTRPAASVPALPARYDPGGGGLRPAQLVWLPASLPDALILREIPA